MTLLPTTILRVILIGVPPSTWWPTSPSQTITFSTVLPSILKTIWYLACLLELPKEPQSTVNLSRPLYPTFVVYLTTIGGRLSFTHRSEMDKSYVKERIRNLLYKLRIVRFEFRVSELLHKDTTVFHSVKHLSDFFCCGRRIRTPDPKVMSLVSYLCSIPQFIFKNVYSLLKEKSHNL